MKYLILLSLFFFGINFITAQSQKTFTKVFVLEEDCHFSVFTLNGNATVKTWSKPTVKINYTIKTPKIKEQDLEKIIKKGRYIIRMRFHEEARVIVFDMPDQEKLIINTKNLEEYLDFEIFLPKGIEYRITPPEIDLIL